MAEAVVRALVEGNVLALQSLVSPAVIDHSAQPGQPAGWPGVRERALTLCGALPGAEGRVDVLRTDGDTALARAELTAIKRDVPPGEVPATVRLTIVFVLRFEDDLLTEMWTSSDLVLDRPVRQATSA